ncbi:MAG: PAS domain-containing protein [Pseudomonadota bacterium]|nr:PAS domain-containing protein [Pseudomonadota bacterium]
MKLKGRSSSVMENESEESEVLESSDQALLPRNAVSSSERGYPATKVVGRNCRFLPGPKTDQSQVTVLRNTIAAEEVVVVELLNYRKDGQAFWNALHLGPIYDQDGRLKYFFESQWDVTELHLAKRGERYAKALAREVSHRLKNVFSAIGGIVNITGRSLDVKAVTDKINDRVQALGRAYEPTLDDAAFGTIEVGQAVRSVLRPYDPEGGRITFIGNGVRTEPNAISTLGLTLHELATNATKYGALSGIDGIIEVSWRHETDRHDRPSLVLEWNERGGPSISQPPSGQVTGFDIADALLSFSRGFVERNWESDGLRARISLPLSD